MNPPTIHQTRSQRHSREAAASTSAARAKEVEDAAVRHDPVTHNRVLDTSHGGLSAAITNASVVLSGDQLVVSVAEAGHLLGVSRAFAYELAARGELPTIHLGRRIVVPKVALLAMVGLSFSQS
jgi:excisionase family DNA binding protein